MPEVAMMMQSEVSTFSRNHQAVHRHIPSDGEHALLEDVRRIELHPPDQEVPVGELGGEVGQRRRVDTAAQEARWVCRQSS